MVVQIKNLSLMRNRATIVHISFIILSSLVWLPILLAPFMNDDFQLLGWNKAGNLIDCLKPFWTSDVSGYYWRPLINSIHSFIQFVFGFHPLPFRIYNNIIYVSICLVLYYFLKLLGISPKNSFTASVFFSVAPSHEIIVGWLGGGDLTVVLFILTASIFYLKKNYFLSSIFFLCALLTKEVAVLGVFLPFVFMITPQFYAKEQEYETLEHNSAMRWGRRKKILHFPVKAFLIALCMVIIIFLYRFLFVRSDILSSPNLSNIEMYIIIKNFFIYIFLSFLQPETLEVIYHSIIINYLLASIFIVVILLAVFIIIYPNMKSRIPYYRQFIFGILWYCLFIIPALPLLMRWYGFTASLGLFIAFAALLNFNTTKIIKSITILFLTFIFILSGIYDYYRMVQWQQAGMKTNKILTSLKDIDMTGYNHLTIWGLPDKMNWVNSLKVGTQEAVHYFGNNTKINVGSPLRHFGTYGDDIYVEKIQNDSFVLRTHNGRFTLPESKFNTATLNQYLKKTRDNYDITIINHVKNNIQYGTAVVKFKHIDSTKLQIYYDGKSFKKIF